MCRVNWLCWFLTYCRAILFTSLWWHCFENWWLIASIHCRKNLRTIAKAFNLMFLTSKIWLHQELILQLQRVIVLATSFLWEWIILSANLAGLFKDLKTEMTITVKKLCFLQPPNFLLLRGYLHILLGFSWIGTKIIIITFPFHNACSEAALFVFLLCIFFKHLNVGSSQNHPINSFWD